MMFLKNLLQKRKTSKARKAIQSALNLHHLGEVRPDGLTLIRAKHTLEIEWKARDIHPWDRDCEPEEQQLLFSEQAFADTDSVLSRLFDRMPAIDVIQFKVMHPQFDQCLLGGKAERSNQAPSKPDVSARTRLWHKGVIITSLIFVVLALGTKSGSAQSQSTAAAAEAGDSGTSTDLFVMIGSDFDRPGLDPRANYNIGIGHTFAFLKKDPIGDELTFGYTYENAGSHGFFATAFGEHTESAGVMKNFSFPKTKVVTGYTWIQSGVTSYTGNKKVQNRLDSGVSLGAIVHFNNNNSIWIQESYNKVVTVPWYTTSSIGYTYSW